MRSLIVDDEPMIAVLLKTVLATQGDCVVTGNGDEAIAAFTAAHDGGNPFDLVCLDLRLGDGGIDGTEVLRRLRAQEHHGTSRSVVMLTTGGEVGSIEDGPLAEADYLLAKPFRIQHLRTALQRLGLV